MKTLTKTYVVTDDMTAAKFASGTLDVFGTPYGGHGKVTYRP